MADQFWFGQLSKLNYSVESIQSSGILDRNPRFQAGFLPFLSESGGGAWGGGGGGVGSTK